MDQEELVRHANDEVSWNSPTLSKVRRTHTLVTRDGCIDYERVNPSQGAIAEQGRSTVGSSMLVRDANSSYRQDTTIVTGFRSAIKKVLSMEFCISLHFRRSVQVELGALTGTRVAVVLLSGLHKAEIWANFDTIHVNLEMCRIMDGLGNGIKTKMAVKHEQI